MKLPSPEDIAYIWKLLDDPGLATTELRTYVSDEIRIPSGRLAFAIDEDRRRQLLVPIAHDTKVHEDRRSAGVQVASRQMLDGDVLHSFVTIVCHKPHLDPLFSIITAEIIANLQENASQPDLCAISVLNRWRELLERPPSETITHEALVGAFGELFKLRQLVSASPEAVHCWVGPEKERHDFRTKSYAMEVKTTSARGRLQVTIHGHDQLESPGGCRLYLAVLRVENSGADGESIGDLIDGIVSMGGDRFLLLRQLAKLEITPDIIQHVADSRFSVRDDLVFFVDEAFPKLTSASFVSGVLPQRVLRLTYQIDLGIQPPSPLSANQVASVYREIAREACP